MARTPSKPSNLAAIEARREALRKELAELDEQAKAAALAAKDAGRDALLAAFDRVKIPAMDRNDAKAIAKAVAKHGGDTVARQLEALDVS